VAFGRCRKCRSGTPVGVPPPLGRRRIPLGAAVGSASAGVPLPLFLFFSFFFVARVERSETREQQ
jgi:hypothetical protein